MRFQAPNIDTKDGFFLVQHGFTDRTSAQCSMDLYLYHTDGEHVRLTGVVHRWERRSAMDFGTDTYKGHDGRLRGSLQEAREAWLAAGRPSFAEPEEWIHPRFATVVGSERVYPPQNFTPGRDGRIYHLPLFETGYFMVGSWSRGRFYHKDGDAIRYTGIESSFEYKDRLNEAKRKVFGPDGETYGDLEEAFGAWEAAGCPMRPEPEGHRLLPADDLEPALAGPRP
ncbi:MULTISPECIES: hypothetical protein [Methylobacterium]|uniref:hypothetical protein n=1 Tax=Methylobacterium radiotolerans TaxID=31998 RepID=UPI0038D218BD